MTTNQPATKQPIIVGISGGPLSSLVPGLTSDLGVEGRMSVVGPALEQNARAICALGVELGLVIPAHEMVFSAGQVFFEGGQPAEVRLALLSRDPDGRLITWERTRTRDGVERHEGPKVATAGPIDGWIAETDRGRCHVTAVAASSQSQNEVTLVWDLRENDRIARADPDRYLPRSLAQSLARVPTSVLQGFVAARAGRIEAVARAQPAKGTFPIDDEIQHWTLVPREGATLVLPFTDGDGITVDNAGHKARLVLSGGPLITYLTTWALWGERADVTGVFLVDPKRVADLRGFRQYDNAGSGGRTYGKQWQYFQRALDELCQHGIQATSEIRARHVEPLIQIYEHTRAGTYYRHAPILIDTLRSKGARLPGGFAQVPLLACRLDAHEAPIAVGFASFWREKISGTMRGPGHWRGPLKELARTVAIYSENEERKKGARAYWSELADRIRRVMAVGGFGEAHLAGEGPDAIATLTPSPVLAEAYGPLLDAQDAAQNRARLRADEIAVRRALGPRKPGKPRKG